MSNTNKQSTGDLNGLDPDKTELGESHINGWVILFAFINILMGISSLSTLQKVSATEERIAKTNLEMVKIRIALEKRDNDSVQMQKRVNVIEKEIKAIEDKYIKLENRLETVENRLE